MYGNTGIFRLSQKNSVVAQITALPILLRDLRMTASETKYFRVNKNNKKFSGDTTANPQILQIK